MCFRAVGCHRHKHDNDGLVLTSGKHQYIRTAEESDDQYQHDQRLQLGGARYGCLLSIILSISMVRFSGNPGLVDLYFLLDVQVGAVGATWVSNNSHLCLPSLDLQWAHRTDSWIEYEKDSV